MKGGNAMKSSKAKGSMPMSDVPKGGKISASGSDAAGPTATTLTQNVKKSVTGDRVQVRGVGAARARSARIY
jgi:ABC-type phosphate transport system substrate-binding protein